MGTSRAVCRLIEWGDGLKLVAVKMQDSLFRLSKFPRGSGQESEKGTLVERQGFLNLSAEQAVGATYFFTDGQVVIVAICK
jgi:hypothetical protein